MAIGRGQNKIRHARRAPNTFLGSGHTRRVNLIVGVGLHYLSDCSLAVCLYRPNDFLSLLCRLFILLGGGISDRPLLWLTVTFVYLGAILISGCKLLAHYSNHPNH